MTHAPLPMVVLGAGGHAHVVCSLIQALGVELLGVCDPLLASQGAKYWKGWPVLGNDDYWKRLLPGEVGLALGMGIMPNRSVRRELHEQALTLGHSLPVLVHPYAWVAPGVKLGHGTQVMAGAIVQPGVRIGQGCILNTRCSVDHDSTLGDHVHLAPGSTICGDVHIHEHVFIGAGATVVQGREVMTQTPVKAGSVFA
jgi:sugar O-acyltransferase (sialic acid O-acetyltransferase NeuD family)